MKFAAKMVLVKEGHVEGFGEDVRTILGSYEVTRTLRQRERERERERETKRDRDRDREKETETE